MLKDYSVKKYKVKFMIIHCIISYVYYYICTHKEVRLIINKKIKAKFTSALIPYKYKKPNTNNLYKEETVWYDWTLTAIKRR